MLSNKMLHMRHFIIFFIYLYDNKHIHTIHIYIFFEIYDIYCAYIYTCIYIYVYYVRDMFITV